MRSKQCKAREFSTKARKEIYERDKMKCLFCQMGYHLEEAGWYEQSILEVMHYVPRSQNGLGIPENGVLGCKYHHVMLDNGNKGNREEMLGIIREYLKRIYKDWDEKKLIYNKWNFLKGEES